MWEGSFLQPGHGLLSCDEVTSEGVEGTWLAGSQSYQEVASPQQKDGNQCVLSSEGRTVVQIFLAAQWRCCFWLIFGLVSGCCKSFYDESNKWSLNTFREWGLDWMGNYYLGVYNDLESRPRSIYISVLIHAYILHTCMHTYILQSSFFCSPHSQSLPASYPASHITS